MKSVPGSSLSIGIYESRNAMGAAAARRFQTWVEERLADETPVPSGV